MILGKKKTQCLAMLMLAGVLMGGGLSGCQNQKKETVAQYQPRWANEEERAEMSGEYVRYLWGNKDYMLVYGHMGMATYLDWTSFVLFQGRGKGPGLNRFAVNTFTYTKEKGVGETTTWEFLETRGGETFVRVNNGEYKQFNRRDNFGFSHPTVDIYNWCMMSLYD